MGRWRGRARYRGPVARRLERVLPAVLALVSMTLVPVFLWGLIGGIQRGDDMQAHAASTTAEVDRVIRKVNNQTSSAVVRYSENGQARTHEIMIRASDLEPGDTVTVRYDVRDPDQVWDAQRDPPGAGPPIWVGLAFAGSIVCACYAVINARAPRRGHAQASA